MLALVSTTAIAAPKEESMQEVLKIAHGISVVQPRLADSDAVSYAIGIHRASKLYNVHPSILIAITQQESGFRAHLPRGPAGEIGICQILDNWLRNPRFIAHFGKMTVNELKKPATSFKVAAWILADLKDNSVSGPLPFWSFYNSREFKNRFKYFLKVTKNLSNLRKNAPAVYSSTVMVASVKAEPVPMASKQARNTTREVATDRKLPSAVKAARLLHPKRLSRRERADRRLIKTASLGGSEYDI